MPQNIKVAPKRLQEYQGQFVLANAQLSPVSLAADKKALHRPDQMRPLSEDQVEVPIRVLFHSLQ